MPGRTDEVVIPPRAGIVEFRDGNHSILRITATDGLLMSGGSLTLTDGPSTLGGAFTVADGASLTARGTNVVLMANGSQAEWGGDLVADNGAIMRLPSVTGVRTAGANWRAQGAGSLIDAGAISSVTLVSSAFFDLTVDREGRILLGGITALLGPLRVSATGNGMVDLGKFEGNWTSEGFSYRQSLTAARGGRIVLPGLTGFDRGTIDIDSPDGLATRQLRAFTRSALTLRGASAQFDVVTNIDDSDLSALGGAVLRLPNVAGLHVSAATWRSQDPGSMIDASAVTEIVLPSNGYMDLNAATDGVIDLRRLAVPRGPIRVSATSRGLVDLSAITGRWTSQGFAYRQSLTASTGGRIRVPGLTELDRGTADLDAPDAIPTSQLTAITAGTLNVRGGLPNFDSLADLDDTDLLVAGGTTLRLPALRRLHVTGMTWRIQDPGSVLDASALTDLTFTSAGYADLTATAGAGIHLSGLRDLLGPLRVTASAGGTVDLTGVQGRWTSEGFSYSQSLTASTGGAILIPGLTAFDRGTLDADDTDAISTGQLQSATRSALTARGAAADFHSLRTLDETDLSAFGGAVIALPGVGEVRSSGMTWRARDPGSVIDASAVTRLVIAPAGYVDLEATVAGRIDLSGLTALEGPVRVTATGGGVVDVSGASGLWSSVGFAYRQSLTASGDGSILIPGITGFDRGQITLGARGNVTTEQWIRLTESTVLLDAADLALGRLRDQTGTTFTLRNGARTIFGARPRILEPPVGRRARVGDAIDLAVRADGEAPLRFQWRRNGQNLPGATTATLHFDKVNAADAGSYTVVVANATDAVESPPAVLSLEIPALPFADAFAQRGRITTAGGIGTGDSSSATAEPGEPRHAGKRGGRSLWIAWRPPVTGRAILDTTGSSFDTLLAVYVGDALGRLTEIASDEDSGGFLAGRVAFDAMQDTEYLVAVDGFAAAGGGVILSWDVTQGALPLPRIDSYPAGGTVQQGQTFTLSVEAEGTGLSYQWFFKRSPIDGATGPTLVLSNAGTDQAGIYSVRVTSGANASIETPVALVEVVSTPGAAPAQDKLEDLFNDPAPGAPVLHSQGSQGFTPVFPGIPGSRETGNNGAQRSPDDPIILGELGGASLWLRFQAMTNGWMSLSTEGSAIATVLGVYTNHTDLQEVALASPQPPSTYSEVLFGAFAGEDYLVMIDGVDGVQGAIQLSYSLALAPVGGPKITFSGADVVLQQTVRPGTYAIAAGSDLPTFAPLFTTNIVGGLLHFTDPGAGAAPRRFYRIQATP